MSEEEDHVFDGILDYKVNSRSLWTKVRFCVLINFLPHPKILLITQQKIENLIKNIQGARSDGS